MFKKLFTFIFDENFLSQRAKMNILYGRLHSKCGVYCSKRLLEGIYQGKSLILLYEHQEKIRLASFEDNDPKFFWQEFRCIKNFLHLVLIIFYAKVAKINILYQRFHSK